MSICTWIIIAIALHEVDNAPDTKASSKSDNECLQNAYCAVKKCHKISPFLPLVRLPEKRAKKRRPVFITAAVISPPDMAGSPRRLNVCGAAVFSCKNASNLSAASCRVPSRGAYHVADCYVCGRVNSSFFS